jgi:uncharacterized protein (DUF2164 family)
MKEKKISISDGARKQSVASIRRYFAEELDQDVGDLKAGLLLEFFLKEIAPAVYNSAIDDARTFVQERLADMEGACNIEEFGYWARSTVRRASR